MRAVAGFAVVGAVTIFASSASAQDRVVMRPAPDRPAAPTVSVTPVITAADTGEDAAAAAKRLLDQWSARLRPIEQRFRDDARLRRAGALVGVGAAAIGALRGQQTLTFVGTQALRVGLDRQLTAIRARSGFTVEPTLGHRSIAITVSRTFAP